MTLSRKAEPSRRRPAMANWAGAIERAERTNDRCLAFVEHRGEPLEDVSDAGCDLEGDGDIGRGGVGSEPRRVVEEDLV